MNTLPAFELAAQQGAQGIELDVHRSVDGYAVVVHDYTVDATTNGHGRVAEMTLAQLRELDAGSWFDARYAGTKIPTLDEVFEAVGKRLFINVEIKSDTVETDGVEDVVAQCVARHQMVDRVIVSSFNPLALQRFQAIAPRVAVGLLYYGSDEALRAWRGPLSAIHPHEILLNENVVSVALSQGNLINTWTVNDPQRARALAEWGVQGIITDYPDQILTALRT